MKSAIRNALPTKDFGLSAERAYPVNDKKHAALAKGRATQQLARGTINAGQANAINTKANRVIGHTFHTVKGQ